ncbi:MAG: GtrA family protein [Xanthobacteraceae bacterium]
MSMVGWLEWLSSRLQEAWRNSALSLKAISFAVIGAINVFVDFAVFFSARVLLGHSAAATALFDRLAAGCGCAEPGTVALIVANIMSWSVAVTSSYVLNSSITFAVESGRRLRLRSYGLFVASNAAGWLASTSTLVFAAQMLLLPLWAAKGLAVLASFFVNFSLAHFIVFRPQRPPAPAVPGVNAREGI